jgi:selenocysteine lyase/cysteine desulfurase
MLPIVGLDAALGIFEAIDGGQEAIETRILGLTNYLLSGLDQLGYPVASPRGTGERSGIVCFSPHPDRPDFTIQQLVWELRDREIYTSPRGNWVRVSPHFYNTPPELDKLLNALEDLKRPPAPEQPTKK